MPRVETRPWERQHGESARAYSAFRMWLETDPVTERSQLGTYRRFTGNSEARAYPGYFRQWIENHRWVERARQYDQFINRQRERIETAKRIKRQQQWEQRREQVADEGWELAEGLIAKAKEILRAPTFEQTVTRESLGANGQVIQEITIKPGRFSIRDAGRLIEVADRLRRLAAEMATEQIEIVTPESKLAAKLKSAREAMHESRELYPDFTDEQRANVIAKAFGVRPEELLEPGIEPGGDVTTSEAIQ
jgi:hypothetical protein